MDAFAISGRIVDVIAGRIFPGTVHVSGGRIVSILETADAPHDRYVLPGFVDAHVHIESSMMAPSEFARFATVHGTVATVSDPHEIGNVLGIPGIRFMVENGRQVPFKFWFGMPSCVPATAFETSGAHLDAAAVRSMLKGQGLHYLAEVMNFPGVLAGDPDMLGKIAAAKDLGLPIDGHAPGLRGEDARRYAAAGPSTDHECFTLEEALDKIAAGMKILIREGSAAKNFAALHPLLTTHPDRCMFCSDDLHPDNLAHGHINRLAARAVAEGHDLMNVLRAATLNPVTHYGMPVGRLRPGDPADLIVVQDLHDFRVRQTYVDGRLVAEDGISRIERVRIEPLNRFGAEPRIESDFHVPAQGSVVRVIEALNGQLVTNELHLRVPVVDDRLECDLKQDVLKLTVVNRYTPAPPAVGFVKGFGLKSGAIASSVAHDSHNVVAVGTSDALLCRAVNALVESHGGLSTVDATGTHVLPLEIAGLMSADGAAVAEGYAKLDRLAREMGATLTAPYMTLAFMALLVIPALKLSDRGLFDARSFRFTSLYVD